MIDYENLLRIEYTILGTVLSAPDYAGEVIAKLSPEVFSTNGTRGLFKTISELHFEGAPIEPVTVIQKAGQDYEPVVREAAQYLVSPESLPYYCDLLLESSRLRQIQVEASSITAASTLEEAGEVLDRMNGMMATQSRIVILDAAQAAMNFYSRQESDHKPEYLHWGMEKLDKSLYAELGDFIVIGGYPSSGKTLLSIQFALQWAQKYRVGYFSLETSPAKLIDRLMSHLSQVPLSKIKTRDLNEADWAALAQASSKLSGMTLDCIDAGGMTVRDIQAVALNKRYQVIIVDYLQLVIDAGKGRYEQVTNISQGLHTMARSNNITVVALAQLSRPEKTNGKPQPPTMSSFRESGQIEQDSDIAILLWPADPTDNRSRRVLKVAKNKEGDRTKFELEFDGARQTMTPAEPTKGEKYREIQKAIRAAGRNAPDQVTFSELTGRDKDLPF